jgi:hypothetical protein
VFARAGRTAKRERNPANERTRGRAGLQMRLRGVEGGSAALQVQSSRVSANRISIAGALEGPQVQTFRSSDIAGSDTGTEAGAPPPLFGVVASRRGRRPSKISRRIFAGRQLCAAALETQLTQTYNQEVQGIGHKKTKNTRTQTQQYDIK